MLWVWKDDAPPLLTLPSSQAEQHLGCYKNSPPSCTNTETTFVHQDQGWLPLMGFKSNNSLCTFSSLLWNQWPCQSLWKRPFPLFSCALPSMPSPQPQHYASSLQLQKGPSAPFPLSAENNSSSSTISLNPAQRNVPAAHQYHLRKELGSLWS